VLRDVASRIERLSERRDQSNLAASTAILAGLVLEKAMIKGILKEEIMRESVIYQEIKAEGKEEGIQQGMQREGANLVIRQLNRRLGQVSSNFEGKIRQLSVEQLESLGEALLDFESESDLVNWLERELAGCQIE
jgi:predicted transposase YdaD